MRRYVGFALAGMVALWLVMLLPPAASTVALALVVGVGAAGGRAARGGLDVVALSIGALAGAAASGATQGLGSGGPTSVEVINGSATVAVIDAIAGFVAFAVTDARRPHPPPERVGDDAEG